MSRTIRLLLLALTVFTAAPLVAQDFVNSPVPLPPLRKNFVQVDSVDRDSVEVTGGGVAAVVDGNKLSFSDLMWVLLENNLDTIATNLVDQKMCEMEMERTGITVSQEEMDEELKEILPRFAPGKTAEELIEQGAFTREYLDNTARTARGWKKLMWAAKGIPPEQRNAQANVFLLRLYKSELMNRFSVMVRGRKPAPPKGAIAALSTIIRGKKVTHEVLPLEAMNFLKGVLRPTTVLQGQRQLVSEYLVQRAMQNAAVIVTDSEIEGYVREMHQKFKPPFSWQMVLQAKGMTPDQERVRWHNVQAWKRATNADVSSERMQEFRKKHEAHFRSRYVKVKHILIASVDMTTGLSKGKAAEDEAKARAERILELIEEGVAFDELCKKFSDDRTNAATGGELPQPVKELGGAYDPAFSAAACKLTRKGELTGPVKSTYGYHIIMANEISPARSGNIDFYDPRYAEWIREEFETFYMKEWVKKLHDDAEVAFTPRDDVLKIKSAEIREKK